MPATETMTKSATGLTAEKGKVTMTTKNATMEKPLAVRLEDETAVALPEPSIANLLAGVIERGVTTENVAALDKLCDLYERMESKKAERSFNESFAKLQSEIPNIAATKAVPDKQGNEKYRYAPYDEIMEQAQPLLTKHGFSVSFNSRFGDGRYTSICKLKHSSGHSEINEFSVRIGSGPPGASEPQADGAAKTYAKRGALCDALNIVVDRDDDARMIGKCIPQELADDLKRRVKAVGANEQAFLKFAGAAHYEAIPLDRLNALDAMLTKKERGAAKQEGDPAW